VFSAGFNLDATPDLGLIFALPGVGLGASLAQQRHAAREGGNLEKSHHILKRFVCVVVRCFAPPPAFRPASIVALSRQAGILIEDFEKP
jgi:hypothetical protein